jgi:hypothetical protein
MNGMGYGNYGGMYGMEGGGGGYAAGYGSAAYGGECNRLN